MKGCEAILREYSNRPNLTVEYRKGYGWFVVDKGQTLFGFNSKRLLRNYTEQVIKRGVLYTPTAKETYG
jgi:hypothetical protein